MRRWIMALFEGYERRQEKIEAVLAQWGFATLEEAQALCSAKGLDVPAICKLARVGAESRASLHTFLSLPSLNSCRAASVKCDYFLVALLVALFC